MVVSSGKKCNTEKSDWIISFVMFCCLDPQVTLRSSSSFS